MRQMMGLIAGLWCAGAAAAQQMAFVLPEEMRASDIMILGEIHDNPFHHMGQAAILQQINPTAVVFEMLTPEMAQKVNEAGDKGASDLGETIGWEDAGWPDYEIYQPIFAVLRDARAVGAAAPRETVRAAFADGAAAVFGEGAERFGLDQPVPETQLTTRKALQFTAHCEAMPLEMMGGMVEAQRLRDAQFSDAALHALAQFGSPVVVITGNGHARRDWGMPQHIALAAPDIAVFSVGFIEKPGQTDDPRFDMTIVTPTIERPDPCTAFQD